MPAVKQNSLTAAFVRSVKDAGNFTDGNGLVLRVSPKGRKSWIQRITVNGKQTALSIGSYPAVGLSDARAIAQDNSKATAQGRNPQQERKQAKEDARKSSIPTFGQAAKAVHELHLPTWSNEKHAREWLATLERFAFPSIGRKPVNEITTADVMGIVAPLMAEKPVTGKRVNQRVCVIFDYCIAQNWREFNPAGRSIAKALPKPQREVKHHKAVAYRDVPAVVRKVQESSECELVKLAFEYGILTAARTNEIRGAQWAEIDWIEGIWTVPAARTKMRRPLRIPLSGRAIEILERTREITGESDGLIFRGSSARMIYHRVFLSVLKRLEIEATYHGFRSSIRDWMGECTSASGAVAEAALGHAQGNQTQQAYSRSDYLELRRPIMDAWADHVAG